MPAPAGAEARSSGSNQASGAASPEIQPNSMPPPAEAEPGHGGSEQAAGATSAGAASLGDIARAAMDPLQGSLPVQAVLDILDHLLQQDQVHNLGFWSTSKVHTKVPQNLMMVHPHSETAACVGSTRLPGACSNVVVWSSNGACMSSKLECIAKVCVVFLIRTLIASTLKTLQPLSLIELQAGLPTPQAAQWAHGSCLKDAVMNLQLASVKSLR